MFGKIGAWELILILGIVLIIFGPSKLPQIGKSIGQALREFKKGATNVQKEINELVSDDEIKDDNTKDDNK